MQSFLKKIWHKIKYKNYYEYIYSPYYNPLVELPSDYPAVYNADGKQMEFFFIRDMHTAHIPYMGKSKYFVWDRFNIGLKNHFYSHNAMLETMGKPDKKYGMLIEAEAVVPDDYKIFEKNKGLEKEFDKIFTFSAKLLDSLPNAVFMPFNAIVADGNNPQSELVDSDAYTKKSKNISIIASGKNITKLHFFRNSVAQKCKAEKLADTFGKFDGGPRVNKLADILIPYRYNICIENYKDDYYFTEKICNCFATMTVPIYCGASKILKFFNPEGIIIIEPKDLDNLPKILSQCNLKDYEQRLPAIRENFVKVQEYLNIDDLLYKKVKGIC